ncbi:MAG: inositol monophosphatase family protein [Gammaproteobacteria bacterium]|nr:inositol monophosphatase family protein [Gammaproteobacteria bacterium]
MDRQALESLLDYYLAVLVTAGDYALAIQPDIAGPDAKDGINAWTQALTDADIAVQNYVEVATLAHDAHLGFFGEESAQSANSGYFDPAAVTRICLDPINGTFLYKNQQDGWDIVLSIVHERRLLAAISYMPASGKFYLASRPHGALTGSRDFARVAAMQSLETRGGSDVCVTYNADHVSAALAGQFRCFDIVRDHKPGAVPDNLNQLFTGGVDAFACTQGDLLDWGALAFVVEQAGGQASDLGGAGLQGFDDFDPQAQTDMLIAATPEVHSRIIAALG